MNDPFSLYEFSNDIFEQYPPLDSNDWFQQPDSKEPVIKFSQHSLEMMGSAESDEKGCIRTDVSLHEEFRLAYNLLPHNTIELELEVGEDSVESFQEAPPTAVESGWSRRGEKRQIEISNKTICLKSKAEKGDRFQTKNICKHLHTVTAKRLRDGILLHQFNTEEGAIIKQFCNEKVCIESFKTLLKNANINTFIKDFYESKYYLREVMNSKMEMKAKLTMIKYLERIRSITIDRNFKAWKKNFKQLS